MNCRCPVPQRIKVLQLVAIDDAVPEIGTSKNRSLGTLLRGSRFAMMGRRVLVVDDEPLVLEVVASMLEELGCETVRVRSGRDALGTIAQDQTIDVLIADMDMLGWTDHYLQRGRVAFGRNCQ